jgi:hypothetical protein
MARIYTNDGYDWGGATGGAPTVTTKSGNPSPTLHDYGTYTSPYTGPSGPQSSATPGTKFTPVTVKPNGSIGKTGTETVPGSTGNTGNGYSPGAGYDWGSATGAASNAYADYLAALQAARAEAIEKANAALDEQGKVAEKRYRLQEKQINRDYDDLGNQSEVRRYKAKKSQREALANRGALDSGAGRFENTVLQNNFDNNLNKINLQRQSELDNLRLAIEDMWAKIRSQQAANETSTIGNFADAIMYGLNSGALGNYAYNPGTSDYYSAASNLANTSYTPTNAVSDGQTARASTAALKQAFDELSRNPLSIGDYIKNYSWI